MASTAAWIWLVGMLGSKILTLGPKSAASAGGRYDGWVAAATTGTLRQVAAIAMTTAASPASVRWRPTRPCGAGRSWSADISTTYLLRRDECPTMGPLVTAAAQR